MTGKPPPLRVPRWISIPVLMILLLLLTDYLNRPYYERLERVELELALAGYPDARVNGWQGTHNMVLCHVSQVRKNRGYAFAWKTPTQSGVFCLPTDGRPTRIILD